MCHNMSEYSTKDRTEQNDFNNKLVAELAQLQGVVDDQLRRQPKHANNMTNEELGAFFAHLTPHFQFTVKSFEALDSSLRIATGGPGGLSIMQDGFTKGFLVLQEDDKISGIVVGVRAVHVPSKSCLMGQLSKEDLDIYDKTIAAGVVIENVRYQTDIQPDGSYEVDEFLPSEYEIVIPIVYDMRMVGMQTSLPKES